ncbi:rod shape-determining protein MreC [Agathobaculum sp.]|uniref:rod shape-determining protein MreC n=1 Tax=Agathobaculum sp. TaxID=2048138 RepID=UPI001C3B4161|nr:rod shape-determining protein MreC [Agathobaculum sp.]MBS6641040.1 rod shape-determining protein MreC [Clostridiaceae bacterium]HIX10097.1 rod shape-determining protein MreC [Candidatus Agathobaculum pullistercoris]
MRRRNRLGSRFFIGVAVVIVLCVLSALYSGVTGNPSPVTRIVSFVTTPVQRVATGISNFFSHGLSYFTDFDALQAENEELKRQIREMEQTVRDAELALEENAQLRQQAGQPERMRELTTINAEVIARNPGDWATTLTLDKGSNHGVELGDLVTTVDGMAGYVSELYSNTCEITTVIDVEMQCGALITRTRETAIAEGDYDLMADGNLRLSYLTEDTSVVIGDTVETSGRGGVFPKGVMIGTVESVLPESNGISYYAVIRPFVDVDTISSVSIVTDYTDTTE